METYELLPGLSIDIIESYACIDGIKDSFKFLLFAASCVFLDMSEGDQAARRNANLAYLPTPGNHMLHWPAKTRRDLRGQDLDG